MRKPRSSDTGTPDDPASVSVTTEMKQAVQADLAAFDERFLGHAPSQTKEERRANIRATIRRIFAQSPT